jgi:anti-anti-sigma regulatory factor
MLQAKVQNTITKSSDKIIENIKKSIKKSKSANMTIDISMLNLMDASKVATIASTYHFLKFAEGSINWLVNSKEVENVIKPLNLGNSKFTSI